MISDFCSIDFPFSWKLLWTRQMSVISNQNKLKVSSSAEKCHLELKQDSISPPNLDPHLIQFHLALNRRSFDVLWMFETVKINWICLAAASFTYNVDFNVELVSLLLVLLVACARLRWRWKINFPFTRRWSFLQRALRERNASLLSGWRLLCRMSSSFRLTPFVTWGWRFFTLLQVTASICRLVTCLIEWRNNKNVSQIFLS